MKLQTVKRLVRPVSKKRRFRRTFDSQHDKESKERVKSAWKNFYHIFSSLCEKLIWKIHPLVICENFRGVWWDIDCQPKVSCLGFGESDVRNSNGIIWRRKNFWSIFCSIYGIYVKLLTFWKKKMIFVANLFQKLRTRKDLVRRSTCL